MKRQRFRNPAGPTGPQRALALRLNLRARGRTVFLRARHVRTPGRRRPPLLLPRDLQREPEQGRETRERRRVRCVEAASALGECDEDAFWILADWRDGEQDRRAHARDVRAGFGLPKNARSHPRDRFPERAGCGALAVAKQRIWAPEAATTANDPSLRRA